MVTENIQLVSRGKTSPVKVSKGPLEKSSSPAPVLQPAASQNSAAGDPASKTTAFEAYVDSVLKLINQHKIYPAESVDRGEEGRVVIGLAVAADGHPLYPWVVEACPFQRLNNAALRAVTAVESFPVPPSDVAAPIQLLIPMTYRLETN